MIAIYICAITTANLLVFVFGPWWSVVNSFVFIGLDLTLRDKIQDRFGFKKSLLIVLAGGLISYLLNPAGGMIAIASVVSFIASGFADAGTYQALRNQTPFKRINGSNIAGAGVDSILFPTIAFGSLMPHIVLMQFMAKVAGGFVASMVIKRD